MLFLSRFPSRSYQLALHGAWRSKPGIARARKHMGAVISSFGTTMSSGPF
jgi:hypothetical protein